jgi:hypothetical protein
MGWSAIEWMDVEYYLSGHKAVYSDVSEGRTASANALLADCVLLVIFFAHSSTLKNGGNTRMFFRNVSGLPPYYTTLYHRK